jgi:thioredoxin 1
MPCKMIAPVFEAFSKDSEFKKTVFVKVDVDESQELAMKYGVQSMPTFLFLKDGKVLTRFSGSNAAKLRENIQSMQ